GFTQRVRLDRARLHGLFGRRVARWGAINVVLYWVFYLAMLSQLATGGLIYLGHFNGIAIKLHWIGVGGIVIYGVLHVTINWRLGGAAQLFRILRPARLVPPARFDPLDVLALLDERASPRFSTAGARPTRTPSVAPAPPRGDGRDGRNELL